LDIARNSSIYVFVRKNVLIEHNLLQSFSIGVPLEEREGAVDKDKPRQFRLESLHVRGLSGLSAHHVYNYFKEFNPISLEWVDGDSANVVWTLPLSAAKALLALSRPLLSKEDEPMEVNERVAGEEDGESEEANGGRKNSQRKFLSKEEVLSKVGCLQNSLQVFRAIFILYYKLLNM